MPQFVPLLAFTQLPPLQVLQVAQPVPPLQAPEPLQVSPLVQPLPSLQALVVGSYAFAGQVALLPGQYSATSHWPTSARQT